MLAALLVCAAIVLAAAAPGVALAVGDLSAAQDAVGDARLAVRATALAADLADERDDLAVSVAAGQPATPTADQQRTDRQVADVTGGGGSPPTCAPRSPRCPPSAGPPAPPPPRRPPSPPTSRWSTRSGAPRDRSPRRSAGPPRPPPCSAACSWPD